ncbi:HD domain-containing protein [Flocculibacter collagenilyticus]|uniref:HD domain-containing protein n=1 Tax=Flocculibacter collagenilyticus TaxID=2744479 RepID=UPI0018F37563|nr:HD domain-containing protein [Flocculibacter collagenilyticus]
MPDNTTGLTSYTSKYEAHFYQYMSERISTDPAHDINHVMRVVANAKSIAAKESLNHPCNIEVVIAGAWLHDCITLPKNHPDRAQASTLAAQEAKRFLSSIDYPPAWIDEVCHAVEAHSFSAGISATSLEAKIVQDADRLDGLGAIGIVRCFITGASFGASFYNQDDPFCHTRSPQDKQFSVDHFYVKLFKLAELMQTTGAKQEARQRIEYMKGFLAQLEVEIN